MWREILKLLGKDNLQTQALRECHEMLDICSEMVVASVDSLRRHDDASVNIDIYAMDKKLNSFERDVRRKVMTHLTISPDSSELNAFLLFVSIAKFRSSWV